jgi:group I intron endonuclease
MYGIIYLVRNKINNKKYIGQTVNSISVRWTKHKYSANHNSSNNYFLSAVKKYGEDNFIFETIKECETQDELNYWEEFYINQYNTRNRKVGYNTREGGSHGKHTEATKQKLRLANLGKKLTDEHKQRLSEAHKGKRPNDKTRQLMSDRRAGIELSENHCKSISDGRRGMKFSDRHKKNISKSKAGTNSHTAKLTWVIVKQIREDYKKGISTRQLSKKYGVCGISGIINNKTWVDENYDTSHLLGLRLKNNGGDKNGQAKLNWEKVRAIREEKKSGMLDRELATKYGVTRTTITLIVNNKTWSE